MTEQEWLKLITEKIKSKGRGYYISWWLRIDTGIPTPQINYHLGKLVDKGLLIKKSYYYGIEYRLPDTPLITK